MDLESEYNNRARVPEHARHLAAWQRDAAAWRETCPRAELGLSYGTGERERLDLFWPAAAGDDAPLVMFIHGGYWQALGREWASHCARGLNLRGVAVAVPSYDLCPTVTVAAIVAQMRAAARFLHARHGRPMLAAGHSAGGHLAAMLLAQEPGAVRAALPISGVFDLSPLRATSIGVALNLSGAEARAVSPRFLPRPAGLLHCIVGGAESGEFIRQSREMAEAWGGGFEALPGADHFTVLAPLSDPDSAMTETAKRLATA